VRPERPEDLPAIRSVNAAAFGRPDEATLVEWLRDDGVVLLSLVAKAEKQIAGHILFSRMFIETAGGAVAAVALAAVAVLPEFQRRGIGGGLIRHGLDLLRARGERIVIVLGDHICASGFQARRPALIPGALDGICGRVEYPAAFGL
jgi:putative acetyltransferase